MIADTVAPTLRMSVVIVTYNRPELLRNCLAAVARQTRLPDQIVLAGVQGDTETRAVVEAFNQINVIDCLWVESPTPSVTEQTDRGVAASAGEIIVFTNDDAEPYPDWLARIEPYYADPTVGGVGGRDFIHTREGGVIDGPTDCVGTITWFGRVHGNHHLSYPQVVDVDVLKGVNMSCRKYCYQSLDSRLIPGGRWHWELDLCLGIRASGMRLVFDPDIVVDHYHYQAARPDTLNSDFVRAANHNLTLCQAKHLKGWRRSVFLIYNVVWGDYPEMGLAVFARTYIGRLRAERDVEFIRLLGVSMAAKRDALAKLRVSRLVQTDGRGIR